MYKSISFDPLSDLDLRNEHFEDGSCIVRNRDGQIVRTIDALGVRRDFCRESETRAMMVRKHGVWTKVDGGAMDESGTLFYRRGDVEIQERLNGVHVHMNRQTGVMIQTDHLSHSEIMKQANGEVWKRELDDARELFEMWMQGKLSFRTVTYFEPCRYEAATPVGTQPLVYVARIEQSWASGVITREKFTFRNPINQEKQIALTVPVKGKLMTLRNVVSVLTTYENGKAVETVYELNGGTPVKVDLGHGRRELEDVERVRQYASGNDQLLAFATTTGAEAVFHAS